MKLILAPLLVAAATLAQRRWGTSVGGRIVGLPLTAGPLLLLLAIAEGPHFTAHVAVADQAGDAAATTWCIAYALASRRLRPLASAGLAFAAFGLVAVVLGHLHLALLPATVLASAAIVVALMAWPRHRAPLVPAEAAAGERSDLLVRMVVAAGFTFAIAESAASVGATAAGLIGALPLVTIVLAVATHRREGPAASAGFLQGVMAGSFSVIAFLAALALSLRHLGTAPSFLVALAAALAAQALGGEPVQRLGGRVRQVLRDHLTELRAA